MATKVIIVTGASRGIGLAIVEKLLTVPSTALVLLSRTTAALEKTQSTSPSRVEIVAGDATDFSLGKRAVQAALARFGRVDGLILNHGRVEPVQKVADADPEQWQNAFNVNVISAVSMAQAAIPELRKTKGCILLTSSGAAVKGTSTWGAYGMTKACLNHLALTLQKEEPDITTIAIRPGVVETQMQDTLASEHFSKMEEEDAERFKALRAEGKMLKPTQPGNVMAKLVLEAPHDLTGSFLNWNDEKLAAFQE